MKTKQKWYRIIHAWDEDVVVYCNIHEQNDVYMPCDTGSVVESVAWSVKAWKPMDYSRIGA